MWVVYRPSAICASTLLEKVGGPHPVGPANADGSAQMSISVQTGKIVIHETAKPLHPCSRSWTAGPGHYTRRLPPPPHPLGGPAMGKDKPLMDEIQFRINNIQSEIEDLSTLIEDLETSEDLKSELSLMVSNVTSEITDMTDLLEGFAEDEDSMDDEED
jgi:hypothetical protein